MREDAAMYRSILVPVDLNDEASWAKALPVAVALTRAFAAKLTVMTVVPDFGMAIVGSFFPADYADKAAAEAKRRLAALVATRVPADLGAETAVARGTIYDEIIAAGKRLDADLVVIASHRPGLEDYLLGPNAARVVRHYRRSVLVVRE